MKKRHRLLPGTPVRHVTHGDGVIMGEWRTIEVQQDSAKTHSSANDVYDVAFGKGGSRYLHSCRIEFLEQLP